MATGSQKFTPQRVPLSVSTFWSFTASLVSSIAGLVNGVLIARLLGPDGTGHFSYLAWLATISVLLSGLALPNGLARFVAELEAKGEMASAERLARWVAVRIGLLSILGAAGLFAAGIVWKEKINLASRYILSFMLALEAFNNVGLSFLAGRKDFKTIAVINLLSAALRTGMLALGAGLFGLEGALLGYAAGFIPAAIAGIRLFFSGRNHIDNELLRRVRSYAFYSWLAAIISEFAWGRIEFLFLDLYWKEREVGMFAAALALTSLATRFPLMFGGALLPHFAGLAGSGERDEIKRIYAAGTRLMAFMIFPAGLGAAAISEPLVLFLYGEAFRATAPIAAVLASGSILAISAVGSHLLYGLGRPRFIVFGSTLGAAMSVAAGLSIIPIWGALGAAWSRVSIQFCMVGLGTWYIYARLGCPIPFAALGRILLSSIVCAAAAYLTTLCARGPLGLLAAVCAGAAAYLISTKLFGALEPDDIQRLRSAAARFPGGELAGRMLGWLGPRE